MAGAEETTYETADDGCAERYPAIFLAVVVMAVVGFWCRPAVDVSFRRMVPWRRRSPRSLMPGGGPRSMTLAAARSRESRSAESCAGESENQKFFESLVHSAPSLSFFF